MSITKGSTVWIAILASLILSAAFFSSNTYAVDGETKIDVLSKKDSYSFNKDSGAITITDKRFPQEITLRNDGLTAAYSASAYFTCSDNYMANVSITADPGSTNEIIKGGSPPLRLTVLLNNASNDGWTEEWESACSSIIKKLQGKDGNTSVTVESQKAKANSIITNEKATNVEKAYGETLFSKYGFNSFNNLRINSSTKDDLLATPGCTTIGGSVTCQDPAGKIVVGRCWRKAILADSDSAVGGGEHDISAIFAQCLSKFTNQPYSDLLKQARAVDINHMENIKKESEKKTLDDLNSPADPSKAMPEEEKTCASQGLVAAWVLCPLLDGAIKLADWSWSLFEVMLAHNPIRQYKLDDQGKPTTEETGYYTTWSYVRNIANVALVLLFLFVIYSQITGYGISNYGIKQSLPRIIVIAILINVSFFLIQIAFDIASVVGATMNDMIAGQVKAIPSLENLSGDIIKTGALGLGGGAIAFGAVAVAGSSTAMLFFALLILPGVVALIAGFFTVLMRNALLPIVAVLAPLAMVAYALPNTASLFEKWKKTFTSLLFLYPTAAIYYAALKAAAIMMIGDENPDATLQRLMGFALLLFGSGFIVILAIKSNAITGKIMGGAQGILSRMASPIEKIGRDTMSAMALDKMGAFRSQDFGNKSRWNPKRYIGKSMQSFDRRARDRKLRTALRSSEADQQYNQGVLADTSRLGGLDKTIGGQAYINKLQSDAVANKEISLRNEDINSLGRILENAIKSGDAVSARAAQKSLLGSGAPGIQKLQNTLSAVENSGIGQDNSIMSSLRQDINSAGIKGKDAVLATWGYQNGKTIDQVRSDANTYSGLNAIEAAGQSVENLTAGVASGGITADIVKRIDSSDAAQSILTGKKSGILESLREK